ncbi:MAG: glycosyltransferase family 8 protein [Turicibacter sp.]|nr:glycosyltransferase family 8 protein [Turicibacter sp.]
MTIPIVLISDEKFLIGTHTTINSILINSFENTKYVFYLLTPETVTQSDLANIFTTVQKFPNSSIEHVNMGLKPTLTKKNWKSAARFKFRIPDVITDHDKCLYLDSDVCVTADLTDLFNTELAQNYIAGVRSFLIGKSQNHHYNIGLPNLMQYVNTGVLLMNLKTMRDEDVSSKFLSAIDDGTDYKYVDQDCINKVCYNRIQLLPTKFNVTCVTYDLLSEGRGYTQEADEILNNPVIIHYTRKLKPWKAISNKQDLYWHKVSPIHSAQSYQLFEQIFNNVIVDKLKYRSRNKKLKKKLKYANLKNQKLKEKLTAYEKHPQNGLKRFLYKLYRLINNRRKKQ